MCRLFAITLEYQLFTVCIETHAVCGLAATGRQIHRGGCRAYLMSEVQPAHCISSVLFIGDWIIGLILRAVPVLLRRCELRVTAPKADWLTTSEP